MTLIGQPDDTLYCSGKTIKSIKLIKCKCCGKKLFKGKGYTVCKGCIKRAIDYVKSGDYNG